MVSGGVSVGGVWVEWRWLWSGLSVGVLGALWLDRQWRRARARIGLPAGFSYAHQNKQVGTSEKGSPIYGSVIMDGDTLVDGPLQPNIKNIYDNFLEGLRLSDNGECLGMRDGGTYHWLRYSDVLEGAQEAGMGMRELGLATYVGIYARNGPEWVMAQLGAASQSVVVVPLYDTLGADAVSFVVHQADIAAVVIDDDAKAEKLLSAAGDMPSLKTIVSLQPIKADLRDRATQLGLRVLTFAELRGLGAAKPLQLRLPALDDVAIICYTSGTTGLPKGVMLSHRNLLANAAGNMRIANMFTTSTCTFAYTKIGQITISYLPLAHLFEQMSHILMFNSGGKVGFFGGDIRKLMDDCQVLRPHIVPVVPRLLNRVSDAIKIRLDKSSWPTRALFDWAYASKLAEMKAGVIRRDSIWDRLVFNKIQGQLGGRVELMMTGSAPISPEVLEMCRVVMGAVILEGYGQTECTAVATITTPGDIRGGHVGGPGPAAHVTLIDVPELQYFSKDGKGEVCVRGPCVTKGYFKDPEKTADTIDEDGWLHTGDIGLWERQGTLRIIDRKKHIFKLAQGEYVAPEKIESIYTRSVAVEQVFVDGSSLERYLVAVVVPNESDLRHWWKETKGTEPPSFESMCVSAEVRAYVLAEMRRVGKENGLNSMEQVQAVHLSPELFSAENGLLTPTMKSKRPALRKHFSDIIAQLYTESQ